MMKDIRQPAGINQEAGGVLGEDMKCLGWWSVRAATTREPTNHSTHLRKLEEVTDAPCGVCVRTCARADLHNTTVHRCTLALDLPGGSNQI